MTDAGRAELIFRVASEFFAEKGYAGTSIREIADAVGVRAPSLYSYYPSKLRILDDMILTTAEASYEVIETALHLDTDLVARVIRGMEEQVRFRLRNSTQMITMSRETMQLSPPVRERVLELTDLYNQQWCRIVEEGVQQGRFVSPDTRLTAQILTEMCSYVAIKTFWRERQVPEARLVHLFSSTALTMLSPSAPVV